MPRPDKELAPGTSQIFRLVNYILMLAVSFAAALVVRVLTQVSAPPSKSAPASEPVVASQADLDLQAVLVSQFDLGPAVTSVPEAAPVRMPVSIATLNRIFKESEAAFASKDYDVAGAKCKELISLVQPEIGEPVEMLYYQIGICSLLGGRYCEAEEAFKDSIRRYPKGYYTSRSCLGLGKAYLGEVPLTKREQAIAALRAAAADPRCKAEATRCLDRIGVKP